MTELVIAIDRSLMIPDITFGLPVSLYRLYVLLVPATPDSQKIKKDKMGVFKWLSIASTFICCY